MLVGREFRRNGITTSLMVQVGIVSYVYNPVPGYLCRVFTGCEQDCETRHPSAQARSPEQAGTPPGQ